MDDTTTPGRSDGGDAGELLAVLVAEREIRRLLDRYQLVWDLMTVDDIRSAEFFAPHARFVEGANGEHGVHEGVEAIVAKHVRRHELVDVLPKGLHTRMNYVIDVEPGCRRASVTGTFIYVQRDSERFYIGSAGRYDDIVECDADGRWWIVEHRTLVFPDIVRHDAVPNSGPSAQPFG